MHKENGTGSWMVYADCDEEYATQVTAEHKVSVKKGGKSQLVWVQKTSHADNHYLDTEVYCIAAADTLGARMFHLQDTAIDEEVAPVQQEEREENWIKSNESWIGG